MPEGELKLYLSSSEALVLYDWLASTHERGLPGLDDASATVLWDLESQLEPLLVAIVQADYSLQVENARARVLGFE